MAKASLSKPKKLSIVIGISCSFFLAEIAVGFYTHSLALVADAFHYLNDLIGFIVALVALKASQRDDAPPALSFGWQRATLLGAFFNGVFLLALGVSIFLQAIERFVSIEEISQPRLVMIIGCVGFALNVVSVSVLHDHDHGTHGAVDSNNEVSSAMEMTNLHQAHRPAATTNDGKQRKPHDLGIAGVLMHVAGDALNNIGVIIAGAIIWKTDSPNRFYADPSVGVAIAFMIIGSAIPLVKKSGIILLQSVPKGVNPQDVKHDIEQVGGVLAVHELHIWRLNQQKTLASAHITVSESSMSSFMTIANTITECLHAYGIHSATLQPEISPTVASLHLQDYTDASTSNPGDALRSRPKDNLSCLVGCQGNRCGELSCCD